MLFFIFLVDQQLFIDIKQINKAFICYEKVESSYFKFANPAQQSTYLRYSMKPSHAILLWKKEL